MKRRRMPMVTAAALENIDRRAAWVATEYAAGRLALEGYPGLTARELIGRRSYKSDSKAMQTSERLIARKDVIEALEQGRSRLGLRLKLSHAQRDELAADGSGDKLDAVLCLMQAAWASQQPRYGLPEDMDALEGWITSA